jgi:hypothetical protein
MTSVGYSKPQPACLEIEAMRVSYTKTFRDLLEFQLYHLLRSPVSMVNNVGCWREGDGGYKPLALDQLRIESACPDIQTAGLEKQTVEGEPREGRFCGVLTWSFWRAQRSDMRGFKLGNCLARYTDGALYNYCSAR